MPSNRIEYIATIRGGHSDRYHIDTEYLLHTDAENFKKTLLIRALMHLRAYDSLYGTSFHEKFKEIIE